MLCVCVCVCGVCVDARCVRERVSVRVCAAALSVCERVCVCLSFCLLTLTRSLLTLARLTNETSAC